MDFNNIILCTGVPSEDPRQTSGSQRNNVAEKNLGYQQPSSDENYKALGSLVNQFGKKDRSNCKKVMNHFVKLLNGIPS